jgi:hypothetical protein
MSENWTFTKAEAMGEKHYVEIKQRGAHTPESGHHLTLVIPMSLFNAIRAGALLAAARAVEEYRGEVYSDDDANGVLLVAEGRIRALIEEDKVNG